MIMKNKFSSLFLTAAFIGLLAVLIYSCKKDKEPVVANKQVAFFISTSTANLILNSASQTYKVYVGLTTVPTADRIVNVKVSSPTGAVQGTQYTLNTTTVTFEAGTVIDSITVSPVYAQYLAGRKDTLLFEFSNADDAIPTVNNSFKLYVRGPCFEGEFVAGAFKGSYPKTNELFGTSAYGPYLITISDVTQLTATTGKVTVTNIWDSGWNPLDFILDWTDPANRTVVPVAVTSGVGDAGTLNPAYAGMQVAVRPYAGQPGTFSFCNKTILFKMQLGVTGLGYYSQLYTVTPGK
jgi:predicted transcriptional regulator